MTAAQCRAARSLLNWTQTELAAAAAMSRSTVADFELERRQVSPNAVAAMRKALEKGGVIFTSGREPGIKLRRA